MAEAPKFIPAPGSDPVAGVQRIYDSQMGIGFILFPPFPLTSAIVCVHMTSLFLKRTDNGALGKPFLLELVMN